MTKILEETHFSTGNGGQTIALQVRDPEHQWAKIQLRFDQSHYGLRQETVVDLADIGVLDETIAMLQRGRALLERHAFNRVDITTGKARAYPHVVDGIPVEQAVVLLEDDAKDAEFENIDR